MGIERSEEWIQAQTASLNPVDILMRLNWGESDDMEFKSAKGGLPKGLWETYSAMANTHGGIILLGVEDNGTVSGIDNPANLKKAFWDTINNRGKVNINLLDSADISDITHGAKVIIAVRVPQATRYQRPVFIGQNPLTGTYRRNHEGDYHCTEQEVSRMLSDRAEESADSRIIENFGLPDIDMPSLQQYRQRFASHKPSHPWLDEDDKGLLIKLRGWRRDRKTNLEGLTLAGLLMFGRVESIREAIPGFHLDYRERFSSDPAIRWTDRLTIDGTWNGNLFQFYLRVIQRLASDLKLPFQLAIDLFRKGETEVHEAIREALVNALIHADYHGVGGIIIEKYRDRFNFSNPGSLLISFDQLMHGNVSECRNKELQTMFMMIGAAEKAGSGVDKIRSSWASQHWRSPLVQEQVRPNRVDWRLPMVSLIPDESQKRLEQYFGTKFQNFNTNEIQALVTADIEGYVDNARMRQITNMHSADITRLLQNLVAKNALVQQGQARWSRYHLSVMLNPPSKSDNSLHKGVDSLHIVCDSLHYANDSLHKGGDFTHTGDDLPFKNDLSVENLVAENHLLLIADPARNKKRLSVNEMREIILKLCSGLWLSRKQLSELLKRNSEGLSSRFLTPMVGSGLLIMKFPNKPNRVDQAYMSVKQEVNLESE